MKTQIIELTKDNQEKYLDQVADLEIRVLDNMEKNGKKGQLFITGKEDILDYINSKENKVLVAVDSNDKVISAVYITHGQIPFTYNDITKYFKCSQEYKQYIKSKYTNPQLYKMDMLNTYKLKLQAFEYAKRKILSEHPEFESITEFLKHEQKSANKFDEKSVLRNDLNKYISEYVNLQSIQCNNPSLINNYNSFYWTSCGDIFQEFNADLEKVNIGRANITEYENFLKQEALRIHDSNIKDASPYFNATTSNSIEIDTYITDPHNRHSGLARILVYEGIKKKISEFFENTDEDEIFLCSTLHQKNLSSKYVSEFFGLKDNLFVKRRADRDREVHICKIKREDYIKYLNDIEDNLIILYNYNPNNKELSKERKEQILKHQLKYELNEYTRLNKIRNTNQDFIGFDSLKDIMPKLNKIGWLRNKLNELNKTSKGDDERC